MKHRIAICANVFLCVCMMLCIVPAYAVTQTSGTCGEGVTWSYDETTHTLTFSGGGEMDNGDLGDLTPWKDLIEQIFYIVIEDGITSICDYAFEGTTQLKGITIPDSVTSIGESAFERSSLAQIELHDGITYIGRSAFEWSSLEEVTVPAGVKELSFGVFRKCGNLKSVVLSEGLTTIDGDAFTDCTALQSIIIPNSVTVLEDAFLRCSALEQITLGNNVSYISKSCFQDCTALREINIPDSITAINSWAFQNCSALEMVTIGAGVETLATNAFWGCTALKTFVVDPDNPLLCGDDAGVIYNKDRTRLILMPNGYVGEYAVQEGTETIGQEAGYGCLSLTGLILPDSVTEIDFYAFLGCSALKYVKLGEGLERIRAEAFRECKSLESVVFPASLTRLDNLAFGFCTGLRTIEFYGICPYFERSVFSGSTADAYYPEDDATWDIDLSAISDQFCWKPRCAGEHTFVNSEAVPPSCETSGKTESTYCGVCGFVSACAVTVPATGHSYGPWKYVTSAAVPEEKRIVERACETCGYTHSEFAIHLDASRLPELPTDAPGANAQPELPAEVETICLVVVVIAVVAACFVGVEVYLVRGKKR